MIHFNALWCAERARKIMERAMFTYQVEYMTRPDETDIIKDMGTNLKGACDLARRMSDKHDGSAYVVALRYNHEKRGVEAVGHIVYWSGVRSEVEGVLKDAK